MGSKQLCIDFFTDGIAEVEFNCIDIPIAAACGKYKRENYFLYLLQICVSRNWKRKDGERDLLFQYMSNLGLKFESIQTCEGALVDCVRSCIDADWPVLLPVTYYEMFFTTRYKRNTASHFLLVEGYMEENEVLLLREELGFISSEKLKEQKGLYPLRLKNEMVETMWINSQKWVLDRMKGVVFTVKSICRPAKISGVKEFLRWILEEYVLFEDLFVEKIVNLSGMADINLENEIFEMRTDFHKYMYAFFYLLKNCIVNKVENSLFDKLLEIESEILMFREISISKFHISRIKHCPIDLEDIKERSVNLNQSLYIILKQIYEKIEFREEEGLEIDSENMAFDAMISASSCEDEVIKGPKQVLLKDQTIWKSQKTDTPHWIMFQFPKCTNVHEMTIVHHKEAHKMTVDFMIQGSLDSITWKNLEKIENNDQPVTRHVFESACYLYYRIYITLPALRNNAAIIKYISMK